jgi:hypothetical protein
MEDLLDVQLAGRLQVGARPPRFGEDLAVFIGEEAYGLGAAGVDAEYVEH